ncbi:unnamed protein product [Prorocentrum cordatum]|uniref:Uncharacterized protein n=1 Tax=Prorocentrum cordatum TaxID=2364126 RepID=A0ABN9PW97_9DINO|nr:unnamed protein product [Polarella glacialis]
MSNQHGQMEHAIVRVGIRETVPSSSIGAALPLWLPVLWATQCELEKDRARRVAEAARQVPADDAEASLSLSSHASSKQLALEFRQLAGALPEARGGQPKATFEPAARVGIGGAVPSTAQAAPPATAVENSGDASFASASASASHSRKVHPDRLGAAVAQLQGHRESDKRRLLQLEQRLALQLSEAASPAAALARLAEAQGSVCALSEEVQALSSQQEFHNDTGAQPLFSWHAPTAYSRDGIGMSCPLWLAIATLQERLRRSLTTAAVNSDFL